MVLDDANIVELIESGTSENILAARKKAKKLRMHLTGEGMTEFLKQLDDYETAGQKKLREKLAKSNRANFAYILRPLDKIFTAKGGAVNYNVRQKQVETLKSNVSDIADGLDIRNYLKKIVRKQYIIDPNGILFCDINEEGEVETYVVDTQQIWWYKTKGNKVQAIIFEPYIEDELEHYRVIDDKFDRIYTYDGDNVTELKASRLDNYFKFCPARILGDAKDHRTGLFESIVDDVIDDADIMLRRMSVMNVHELAHLYPRYWTFAQECTRCKGEGELVLDPQTPSETKTCPSCGGTGEKTRTNPSDELFVPYPKEGEPVVSRFMGYESPDLETARFYKLQESTLRDDMMRTMWGSTYELSGKRETATGRFIDAQPVADRLKEPSYSFAQMHKFLLDCYGKVILQNPKYECSVTYGTRYFLEGADDILQKYMEVTRQNTSDVVRMDMLIRYYESEYKDDPIELAKRKKLAMIEPLPNISVDKVLTLPVSDEIKRQKVMFSIWLQQIRPEKLIILDTERLRDDFLQYVATNNLNFQYNESQRQE